MSEQPKTTGSIIKSNHGQIPRAIGLIVVSPACKQKMRHSEKYVRMPPTFALNEYVMRPRVKDGVLTWRKLKEIQGSRGSVEEMQKKWQEIRDDYAEKGYFVGRYKHGKLVTEIARWEYDILLQNMNGGNSNPT